MITIPISWIAPYLFLIPTILFFTAGFLIYRDMSSVGDKFGAYVIGGCVGGMGCVSFIFFLAFHHLVKFS